MEKILVLGGSSFFGKRLVKLLLEEGHQVSVLSRGNKPLFQHENLEHLVADRTDPNSVVKAIDGRVFDTIYDQIGYASYDAQIICDALRDKTKNLIFTSSLSVYNPPVTSQIQESDFDPENFNIKMGKKEIFDYPEGKRQAEAVYYQRANFDVIIARPPIVIGPDDTSQRIFWHIKRILKGQPIFVPNPKFKTNFISSADAAQALSHLRTCQKGIYNIETSAHTVTEILDIISEAAGKKWIKAEEKSAENSSPYGAEKNMVMNCQKMADTSFISTTDLPELITDITKRVIKKLNN